MNTCHECKHWNPKATDTNMLRFGFARCDRPMQRGCHSLFDNYALVSRGDEERRFVEQAIARTQVHIALVLGWPKSVPMPKELKELLKNRGAKHD
nr:MAG TPA: hypothetical protein [Caudoviricetes sp.]